MYRFVIKGELQECWHSPKAWQNRVIQSQGLAALTITRHWSDGKVGLEEERHEFERVGLITAGCIRPD